MPDQFMDVALTCVVERAMRRDGSRYATLVKKVWGNGKMISRKEGSHFGYHALVYDWTYDYLTPAERKPDNNEAERAIRPVAIGRKNWLFCGSDNGGRTAAVLMTICASCKQYGVKTFAYIRDMLVRVSTEPASRIRELLPDRWKAEREAAAREAAAARAPPA
jgi:hypothetical protein